MEFLNITDNENQDACFKSIADKLFNEYAIQTPSKLYRIIDLEFYWNSNKHKDNSTYERKHVKPKLGDWFFHYSGVDIALDNEFGYGGILIRGVFDIEKNKLIKGPLVVTMNLFSGANAFNGGVFTKIIPDKLAKRYDVQTPKVRGGLGKNAKENNFDKKLYRFYIIP